MWTPPCGCSEINYNAKIIDKWAYEWKYDPASLVKALRHDSFSYCPTLTNSAFIYKPFLHSSRPASLHCPCPIFCLLLSLPLFFYLCPFHDSSWPHLYSPNLSLWVPSFHLLFSPSLPVLSTPTYCGSCLTHHRRGGKRSMNSLWRINMQIIHTALKQICQQPTALRSLTSLSNHIGHIFSLLSLSCQWFDKGCLI